MCDDRQSAADQILKAIEYGFLPVDEIERRLQKTISEELSCPIDAEYDREKVELCYSLLQQIHLEKRIDIGEYAEIVKARIAKRHSVYKHRKKILTRGLCATAVLLVIFVGLSVLNVIPPIQWFSGNSTEDEQQYVVMGHEISVETVASAIAEHNESGSMSLSTVNYSEIVDFLGFDPMMPLEIMAEYKVTRINVLIMPNFVKLSCYYGNEMNVQLNKTIFDNSNDAYIHYEQDKEGDNLVINGFSVYHYTNSGRIGYLWFKDTTIYSLVISDTVPETTEIVHMFFGGYL